MGRDDVLALLRAHRTEIERLITESGLREGVRPYVEKDAIRVA